MSLSPNLEQSLSTKPAKRKVKEEQRRGEANEEEEKQVEENGQGARNAL